MSVINNEKWHKLTPNGNAFEGEVTVEKGLLRVSGQIRKRGESYWAILEYHVE